MREAPQLLCQHAVIPAGDEWTSPRGAWVFLLATEGAGYLFNSPGIIEFTAGAVAVYPPAKAAVVRASQIAPLRLEWFIVDIALLFGVLTLPERRWLQSGYDDATAPNPWVIGMDDPLAKTFRRLCNPCQKEFPSIGQRADTLTVLASYLARFVPGPQTSGRPYMNSLARLDQIVHRLTESEFLSLSADDLADRCRCDRRRVLQLFRQSFGISLRHQQGQLRKLRATQMLEQGANLNEVSKECGYDNADTFRAWFRRAFGTGLSRWLDGQPEPQKQDATESD